MKMDKENCGKAMLDEYRAVVVSGPETSNISWGVRKAVNTTSLANGGNMDASVRAPAPTAALTMQQRYAIASTTLVHASVVHLCHICLTRCVIVEWRHWMRWVCVCRRAQL